MRSLSGILGAVTFLLLLSTVGGVFFPDEVPDWKTLLGAAAVCAVTSVVLYRLSAKSTDDSG